MKIDYCKVVEDLMPLYCDELVSKETGEFIEYHMNQCSTCKKKYDNICTEVPDAKIDVVHAVEEDKFKSAKSFFLRLRSVLEINGTAGGNLEGPDKVGIGFGIDTEDNLWETSKKIIIAINKPIARLVIDQKIDIKESLSPHWVRL